MLVLQCGVVIMRGIRYSLLISGWRKTLEHTMGVIGPIMPIPHSDGLSGSGPWTNSHPNWYFTKAPYGYGANITKGWGFRTEIGTAVFTTFDSFKKFMPEKIGGHVMKCGTSISFGNSAGNASPDKYFSTVEFNYGKAKGIEDFCRKAQLVNVEVNKAMYEGFQHHIWEDASGILT